MAYFRILFAALLFYSHVAFATYIPQQKSLTVGGYTFQGTELSGLIILYGKVTTSGRATTLRLANGTAGYQPTGNGITIRVVRVICDVGSCQSGIGYGDTDVSQNSASAPTTPKYIGGDSTPISIAGALSEAGASGTYVDQSVPASKYIFAITTGSAVSVVVYATQNP